MEFCEACDRPMYGDSPDGLCGWCSDSLTAWMERPTVLGTPDSWTYSERYAARVFDGLAAGGGLDW